LNIRLIDFNTDMEWRIWHGAWTTYLPELHEKFASVTYELQASSSIVDTEVQDIAWRIWHGAWTTYLPELHKKFTSLTYELQASSSIVDTALQDIAWATGAVCKNIS
jgi:hypothetical protein